MQNWRQKLPAALEALQLPVSGDAYEFGVFEGESMHALRRMFPEAQLWGFDSFRGLPEERQDLLQTDFRPGHYAATVRARDMVVRLGADKTGFVAGFFNRTLTPSLRAARGMRPAFYLDVDADLYTSSYQALDWAFQSGVVRRGTLVGYDDFWTNPCSKGGETLSPLATGEGRAHREVAERHGARFRCVAGSCRYVEEEARCDHAWGPIFVVESIGPPEPGAAAGGGPEVPNHGFEMTREQIQAYKARSILCQKHFASPYHWLYTID